MPIVGVFDNDDDDDDDGLELTVLLFLSIIIICLDVVLWMRFFFAELQPFFLNERRNYLSGGEPYTKNRVFRLL